MTPSAFDAVKGLESEPEGGARCTKCFGLRLRETARKAKELGADYFTTTLSVSPHKNAQLLNEIGIQLEKEYGVKFLRADFKRRKAINSRLFSRVNMTFTVRIIAAVSFPCARRKKKRCRSTPNPNTD